MRRSSGFSKRESGEAAGGVSQRAGALSDLSPRGQALDALRGLADHGPAAVAQRQGLEKMFGGAQTAPAQRMKIRDKKTPSSVSGATSAKHIPASGERESVAVASYQDSTFVASEAALTGPVDANEHNFPDAEGKRSEKRKDITADVVIYQYRKKDGVGKNKPVELVIDGVATSCQIGAEKTGDERVSIVHFMKN